MKKTILMFAIIGMFLSTTLLSPVILADEETTEDNGSGLFQSEINFEIENEINGTIQPGETKTVEFKVKYKLAVGNLAKWFLFKRRIGRLLLFGLGYSTGSRSACLILHSLMIE